MLSAPRNLNSNHNRSSRTHLTRQRVAVSEDQQTGIIRKLLPFTSAAVVIALLYVGYVFYSRHQAEKDAEQKLTDQQAADVRKTSEAYGGNELKILTFYATAGPIRRGETTQLCYSVSNAQSLKIEPDVHDVPVSYSNCVKVSPTKDTTYVLSATSAKGKTDTAELTIPVR